MPASKVDFCYGASDSHKYYFNKECMASKTSEEKKYMEE
jgi:hypothetical protein